MENIQKEGTTTKSKNLSETEQNSCKNDLSQNRKNQKLLVGTYNEAPDFINPFYLFFFKNQFHI